MCQFLGGASSRRRSNTRAAAMAREVILRLQYPEEIGAVSECELDGILKKLQQVKRN